MKYHAAAKEVFCVILVHIMGEGREIDSENVGFFSSFLGVLFGVRGWGLGIRLVAVERYPGYFRLSAT